MVSFSSETLANRSIFSSSANKTAYTDELLWLRIEGALVKQWYDSHWQNNRIVWFSQAKEREKAPLPL